ncbi:MAG: FMN-binding protein [Nocardioides sp.]
MRRIVLWLLSTISVVVLLFGYHTSTSGPSAAQSSAFSAEAPATAGSATSGTTKKAAKKGPAKKTVAGATAQTQWGPVQVQITTQAGKITNVDMLQYPQGNSQDDAINSYALPILMQSTLQAQSAQIDMVSGATITSTGYLQSLQSAIDQAGL